MSIHIQVFFKSFQQHHFYSKFWLHLCKLKAMLFLLRTIWLWGAFSTQSHEVNYQADMTLPIGIPIILAGNFGELRPNHFHTGIDIKTNGKEGFKLYAIADGYVARIKTSSGGYGKVLYVNHPEYGITSVYAHCQNFSGQIAEYTLEAQVAAEFYEVDIEVPAYALPVKRGEVIALSGNTGSSTAPHLHFEIRETSTENPMNPLLFKFIKIADTRAPNIQQLVVYALSAKGYRIPEMRMAINVKVKEGRYYILNDTLDVPAHFCSEHGGIGLGLSASDKYNGAENVCGIHHGVLTLNGDTVHQQIMNRLDFEVNRQINTHKDYEAYKQSRTKIDKYFRSIHNRLPIYDPTRGKGILGVQPDHVYDMLFSISDIARNNSVLEFVLRTLQGDIRAENTPFDIYHKDYLYPDSAYVFSGETYSIYMLDNSIYEPVKRVLSYKNDKLIFGDDSTPLHSALQISLKIPERYKNYQKQLILYQSEGKNFFNGQAKLDWFTASARTFGTFSLDIDTIAPKLLPKFKVLSTPQAIKRLAWTINDDKSGLAYYALFINGTYHLLEYEHKRKEVFADISKLPSGKHEVKIVARDAVGNEQAQTFEIQIK